MSEIIIVDEEFQDIAEDINTKSTTTEDTLKLLVQCFDKITTELAVEGNVALNFETLKGELAGMSGGFSEIYDEAKTTVDEFIKDIDTADSFLY